MKTRPELSIIVLYNRDFEGAEADPENKARDDIRDIAENIVRILVAAGRRASGLGVTNDVAAAIRAIEERAPTVVFNLCESIQGDNRYESLLPLLLDLAGIAASSGSACTSGSLEPSHVLTAMGVSEDLARGSMRLTVGRDNTLEQIEYVLDTLPAAVSKLRSLSPAWRERASA